VPTGKSTDVTVTTVVAVFQTGAEAMKPAIAYVRVSTSKQGKSGLDLEAQQAALARFAEAEGYRFAATHVEIESGKGADALDRRPQLAAALKVARQHKAPIIVAKVG
jgi:DNA invertase Pin-like site-specific DNA recombinase